MLFLAVNLQVVLEVEELVTTLTVVMRRTLPIVLLEPKPAWEIAIAIVAGVVTWGVRLVLCQVALVREPSVAALAVGMVSLAVVLEIL